MAKKIQSYIKLQIPSGKANPSPPIGPALGQHGLNIMEFCKQFNNKTQSIEPGTPIPVIISVYSDKTFSLKLKTPTTSFLLKKMCKIQKGSSNPSKDPECGVLTRNQLEEIVKIKNPDLTASNMDSAIKTISGSARSMGLKVEGV